MCVKTFYPQWMELIEKFASDLSTVSGTTDSIHYPYVDNSQSLDAAKFPKFLIYSNPVIFLEGNYSSWGPVWFPSLCLEAQFA